MKNRLPLLVLAVFILAALSCRLELSGETPLSQNQIDTLSAQTIAAIAWQTNVALGTQAPPPAAETPAPPPAGADTPTNTMLPTVTWTGTQPPTFTFTPTATLTPKPCNWVQFISDGVVVDNWETTPADHFTKTWTLKNIGSCTWTSGYQLIFDHGDQMGAPASQQLTAGTVAPGQTVDVSVALLSPNVAGTYQGFFKLRASDSSTFGIGPDANGTFWVKIVVKAVLGPPVAAPFISQQEADVNIPIGGTMSTTANCQPGTVVTGGGFSVGTDVHIYTQAKNGNGWAVVAKNNSGATRWLKVYAVCLTLPSISSTQVEASVTPAAGGGLGTVNIDCPPGSTVTGGGFTGKADGTLWTFFSTQSGNGWKASARNFAAIGQSFNVYAVCLSGAPVTTANVAGNQDLAPGTMGYAEIACPVAGQVITGGGWHMDDDLRIYFAGIASGKWRVYARNIGTHTRALQARATCLGVA